MNWYFVYVDGVKTELFRASDDDAAIRLANRWYVGVTSVTRVSGLK